MRYHALACDYDGTIAEHGAVSQECIAALERLRSSGRLLILVTGRQLEDLLHVFPRVSLFDKVVAENGGLLYTPATYEEKPIGPSPAQEFIDNLNERGVSPSVGRVIVATWEPNQNIVMQTIHDLGLELQVIFNKGAVMVLPSGINKATGLKYALYDLGLSPHNVVGVGDAENDHAFLNICECSIAVANALPSVKKHADLVTMKARGEGVTDLINMIVSNDLRELEPRLKRHEILLGNSDGKDIRLSPYGSNILLSGTSGSGKSTFARGFMEQIGLKKYQFCIIDPEGDYEDLEGAVVVGSSKSAPIVEGSIRLLERYDQNVVVNLLGIGIEDRPKFFKEFLPRLQDLRNRTGRPHWIILDEAHHLMPSTMDLSVPAFCQGWFGIMMITVHPVHISPVCMQAADLVIAVGESPEYVFTDFSRVTGQDAPPTAFKSIDPGEAFAWFRHGSGQPFLFRTVSSKVAHKRHLRKYADGVLGPDKSFYFRGPEGRLNIRAQNLMIFTQIAEGIDDETWIYHLRNGDYSNWLRFSIKDDVLASCAEELQKTNIPPLESRAILKDAIQARYTVPA
jgi:HAD superfamily hydrolase (TIGR01484 family)